MSWYSDIEAKLGKCDTRKFNAIKKLTLHSVVSDNDYHSLNLDILLIYYPDTLIDMTFVEIQDFKLPPVLGGQMSFGELFIEDIRDRGYENVNYKICDELKGPSFYCRDIMVNNVIKNES